MGGVYFERKITSFLRGFETDCSVVTSGDTLMMLCAHSMHVMSMSMSTVIEGSSSTSHMPWMLLCTVPCNDTLVSMHNLWQRHLVQTASMPCATQLCWWVKLARIYVQGTGHVSAHSSVSVPQLWSCSWQLGRWLIISRFRTMLSKVTWPSICLLAGTWRLVAPPTGTPLTPRLNME